MAPLSSDDRPRRPGKGRVPWTALGATGLALALSSCAMVRSTGTARTPQLAAATAPPAAKAAAAGPERSCSARDQSAEQVFAAAKEGVAVVSSGTSVGSAFVVAHEEGQTFLVTNAHVVRGRETVRLKWVDGRTDAAQVVARGRGDTPTTDLALLAVRGTRGVPLAMSDQPSAVGQEVFVIGAPKGLEFSLSRGVVSSLRDQDDILQIDAAVNPGNSGGPVLDAGNCVAGVATFKFRDSEGLNFAISASVVRDFLANLPAASSSADQAGGAPPPERTAGGSGGTTLCLFKPAQSAGAERIPCRISRAETPAGQTIYQLAWADGSRNAYAFLGNGRVAIQAESGRGHRVADQGTFRRAGDGVAVRSSSDAIAVIPGLDPVLN